MKRVYLYLILSLLCSCGLQDNKGQKEAEKLRVNLIKKKEKRKKEILNSIEGKELFSIKNIITDNVTYMNTYSVILYYNGADCFTCLKKGFLLIKEFKKELDIPIYIIGSNTNISKEQFNFNYNEYIYYDTKDRMRKELKIVPTPIIMLINKDLTIKKACFLHSHEGKERQKKFKDYIFSEFKQQK